MPTATVALVTCDSCDQPVADTHTTDTGNEVCAECAEQFYTSCAHCGAYATDTRSTDNDQSICRSCANWHFTECDRCELFSDATETTASGSEVCRDCADADYWRCDGCDQLIYDGDACSSCEDDERSDLIYHYEYKPQPRFHGDGPLFLGAELEINVPDGLLDDCASTAMAYLGDLGYLKEDGSIDHGFEIVTHPMSYPWAMDHFPWDMLASLRGDGCHGRGTGLHVHISRAAFASPGHVFRWLKFLYRNAKQVTTLARRSSNGYARFDTDGRERIKDYAKGAKSTRYQAVNTQNDHTFELRMFASSLHPHEIKAAFALAAASVEYTRELTVADLVHHGGWSWSMFVDWLEQHPAYEPLTLEMEALACAS